MNARLTRDVFSDPLVSTEVPYAVLTPDGWTADDSSPLILVLHGANSSREFLTLLQPIVEELWREGALPRTVLACASTPTVGGFYIDRPGEAWENLIAVAFVRLLTREYGVDPARMSLLGSSMGGYGALKIALADPARWQAVAAIAPALLPAHTAAELRPRNTLDVLAQLGREMAGDSHEPAGDAPETFAANSVLHRLRRHGDDVRASELAIFLRCGDRDVFAMHDGTEQLHRALWDLDIGHEYHLVHGADHIGPEALAAQRAALTFIGATQRRRAGEDRTAADRELQAAWRNWADGGRQGAPPTLDAFGVTGPDAMRVLLDTPLREAGRADPTVTRRFGVLPNEFFCQEPFSEG